jgi:hypothetical protein
MRMRRLAEAAVAVSILVLSGQAPVWAQGGKTPKLAAVPLSVEIIDDGSTRITGDGPFVDGLAGTRANIDQHGNLIIAFGGPVTFDYSEPVSGDVLESPIVSYATSYISTLSSSGPIQTLGEGLSQCVRLNWSHEIPGGYLRHGFHRRYDLLWPDTTSYAVVTRVAGEMKWIVEPKEGTCFGTPNPDSVASMFTQVSERGRWRVIEYGEYRLPFRLVLTPRLP